MKEGEGASALPIVHIAYWYALFHAQYTVVAHSVSYNSKQLVCKALISGRDCKSIMKRSMSSTSLTVAVILACLSSACHSFTYLHQPAQQSANRIKSRLAAAHEHNKIDLDSIKKRFKQSIVSFGVALAALSLPSLAVELPLTYVSDDKSITFQHTSDLQFSPKPLKTHDKEILFKSETIKGFNAGVTVRVFMF